MPSLKTYLEYIDSNVGIYRTGKPDDPYIPRQDSLPVINNIVTLLEIPSFTEKVQVAGFTEISHEKYVKINKIEENEFLVDYATGIIMFNPIHDGKTFVFSYFGRGLILLSAKRIYTMAQNNPDVIVTLQDYIDEINSRITENNSLIVELQKIINDARLAIGDTELATDNANRAADEADRARDLSLDAYNTTRLVWKEPVAEEADLYTTYPFPSIGWTVQTFTDGKRYRFDGNHWILIDIFGNAIPIVSDQNDGLMTIAEHMKLKSFPVEIKEKSIVVYISSTILHGIDRMRMPFEFDGEIVSVSATCGIVGVTPMEIDIEKSMDFTNWTSVLGRKLKINPSYHKDDKEVIISNKGVQKDTIFRINVIESAVGMEDLTVIITIKI